MSSQYEIKRSIGIGSFGQVFLANKKKNNQSVVIKKIKIKDIPDIEKKTIENQVKLLQNLKHINIVTYKDSFIDKEGFLSIVMQNCQGGDMYQKIRNANHKRFEENQIIDWFIQVCLAIYYMHQKRILHRDLKTQNIFLTGGKVRLGDFGISKVLDENQQLTSTVIGTPYYMSPQQFRFKPYNYKTDIWALGCMLYQMCNLRHAFDAQNISALSVKVLKGNYPPVNSQYSKPLRDLISKLLSVNYKDRPSIVQILKMPFLRKRLVIYIQGCLKQEKNQDNQLDTLLQQAKLLGLQFVESIPKDAQFYSAPIKSDRSSEPHSNKISHKSSKEILDKKALENRKKNIQEELMRQRRQKQKLQQQYKKQEIKNISAKRQEILDKQKQRRKRIISGQKNHHSSSSPNLALMKSKKQQTPPPINNITASQSRSIPVHHNIVLPPIVPKPEPSHTPTQISKSRIFKMQQQYDMNFQQQGSDHQKDDTIYQMLDLQDQQHQQQKRLAKSKPKQSIVAQQISEKHIQQPKDVEGVMNMVNAIKQQLFIKTAKIDQLQTQLLNINFQISEDSIQPSSPVVNPKYQKVQQKINQLKSRIETSVGEKKFQALLKVLNSQKQQMSTKDHQNLKDSVTNILGSVNLGYWHFADQIGILQQSLKKIPQFVL